MKNRIPLIVAGMVIMVLIIVAYLVMPGTLIQEGTTTTENSKTIVPGVLTDPNVTQEGTPSPVLLEQLKSYNFRIRDSGINKWEFGPNTNEITLYVYDIHNQSQIEDLQGSQIGNYTIRIIHDIEFERIRDDVAKNLTLLRNDSRYQISYFSMGTDAFGNPPGHYAEVWVYELTQENRNLDNTIINGWKILVYPVSSPPVTTQTQKINSPNTFLLNKKIEDPQKTGSFSSMTITPTSGTAPLTVQFIDTPVESVDPPTVPVRENTNPESKGWERE